MHQGLARRRDKARPFENAHVSMRLGILALAVHSKVFCKSVKELALVGLHRLETHIAAIRIGKDTELSLLRLCPLGVVAEELQREILIGDMVICVIRIDVEGFSELAISFLSEALVVTFEWLTVRSFWFEASGQAFDFLFSSLAVAGEEGLGLAWSLFFACEWGMALIEILVAAGFASLTTRLTAVRARNTGVFAVSAMTQKVAKMRIAFQLLSTRTSTSRLGEPTWLVSQHLLATNTGLLNQEGTLGAFNIVWVALVFDLRMATCSATGAWKAALWWLSSALQNSQHQMSISLENMSVIAENMSVLAENIPVGEGIVWCGHRSS